MNKKIPMTILTKKYLKKMNIITMKLSIEVVFRHRLTEMNSSPRKTLLNLKGSSKDSVKKSPEMIKMLRKISIAAIVTISAVSTKVRPWMSNKRLTKQYAQTKLILKCQDFTKNKKKLNLINKASKMI